MAASLLVASNNLRLPRSSPYSTSVSTRLNSKVSVSSSLSPSLLTQAPPNPSLPSLALLLVIALAQPPNSLFFASISGLPLLPPAPPIYSPHNPAPLFRRYLSTPTTLTFPLRPPKNCKLFASHSPPLQIPTRNNNHSQLTGSTRTLATLAAIGLTLLDPLTSLLSMGVPNADSCCCGGTGEAA